MNISNIPGRVTAVEPESHNDMPDKIEYDDNLKPNRPAFKDEKEAWRCCEDFYAQNRKRNERDAWILDVFFYKPPFEWQKLKENGLDHKSNIPTGFIAAITKSITPSFKRSANGTKTLTNAKVEGDSAKSGDLQDRISKFIRKWTGWQNLLDCTIQEETLLGRCAWRYTDAYTWKPKFYSTQNSLFPEQCSQSVDEIKLCTFIDQWSPDELISTVKNVKVAKGNGWDLENVVKVLNHSTTIDNNHQNDSRSLVNWMADGAYVASYTAAGPVYVETYTLLAVEPDGEGKVSEWLLGRKNGELLCQKKNKYDQMADAVCVFTFDQGQNTLHSSRGTGRLLSNHHQAFDRNFNAQVDANYMAGKRIVHLTEARKRDWGIQIKGDFVVCPPGIKSEPMDQQNNVEGNAMLTKQLVTLARQIASAYSPSTILPDDKVEKTATEATIDAAKEGELREGILGRFSSQLSQAVASMVRRILNPKTYDEDAKKFQKELKELGYTPEELQEFANCDPDDFITSYSTAVMQQKKQAFCMQAKGNPAYDQRKIAYLLAETSVDSEFAKEIVLVQADPTMDMQAIHDQQMENTAMLFNGSAIVVAPLDNDLVHLQSAQAGTTSFVQDVVDASPMKVPNKLQLNGLNSMKSHIGMHIEAAKQKGAKPADVKGFEQFLEELVKQIQVYVSTLEKIGSGITQQLSAAQQPQTTALPASQPAPNQGGQLQLGAPKTGVA